MRPVSTFFDIQLSNSRGKLPVTFYRDLEGMPEFTDYSMKNRTYRYMEKEALYPFGYGLTYGDVQVTEAKVVNPIFDS